ncbi:hypothetical protein DFH07DRAFT_1056725 [Mycena maculata]|uniref:DUF6533 domain-containing protein n=1 Tax=Mycena maculata TaxID=230809 RepID=A0AAD7NTZ8_9AGAR|nr:hypothetical protein DFH07DRAFT_1056725 [Mycena maculata]
MRYPGRRFSIPRLCTSLAPSMSNDEDAAEVLQLVADSRLTGYLAAASVCILIYDHIACIPDEVEHMWKSRWGVAKIVYLWNRYFSLIVISLNMSVIVRDIGSSDVCIGWLRVQGSASTVVIATIDFVLMLRVWILYRRQRWTVYFFVFLGSVEVVTMIIIDLVAFAQMKEYVHLGSIIKGCYAYNVPRILSVYAAAPLLVTFIMFIMTLYQCSLTMYRTDHRVMPLWMLFLRDGVVWFVLVFAAGGSELLIWSTRRETLKQLLLVPALVVYSTVASRSLLNIKKVMSYEAGEEEIGGISTGAADSIVFVS